MSPSTTGPLSTRAATVRNRLLALNNYSHQSKWAAASNEALVLLDEQQDEIERLRGEWDFDTLVGVAHHLLENYPDDSIVCNEDGDPGARFTWHLRRALDALDGIYGRR